MKLPVFEYQGHKMARYLWHALMALVTLGLLSNSHAASIWPTPASMTSEGTIMLSST